MQNIIEFINERLNFTSESISLNERLKLNSNSKINRRNTETDSNVDVINVKELNDLRYTINNHILSRFLKGTEHKSSLNICLINLHKYLHIHRYEDMHQIKLTIVCNNSIEWPNKEEWENNSIEYNELDDRSLMRNLVNNFYNFLKNTIK